MTRRNVSIFENYKTVPNHSTLHIIQQVQRICFPTVVCLPCLWFYEVFLNFVLNLIAVAYFPVDQYTVVAQCAFKHTTNCAKKHNAKTDEKFSQGNFKKYICFMAYVFSIVQGLEKHPYNEEQGLILLYVLQQGPKKDTHLNIIGRTPTE